MDTNTMDQQLIDLIQKNNSAVNRSHEQDFAADMATSSVYRSYRRSGRIAAEQRRAYRRYEAKQTAIDMAVYITAGYLTAEAGRHGLMAHGLATVIIVACIVMCAISVDRFFKR